MNIDETIFINLSSKIKVFWHYKNCLITLDKI